MQIEWNSEDIILNKPNLYSPVNITINQTSKSDLNNILTLWNDGEVMKFVGFPNGLGMTLEQLQKWYQHIESSRPRINHYSIYHLEIGYCGETFYAIDELQYASLDIKLFPKARGKGIASKALTFAINEAFKHGANKVWVDPNPNNIDAIALYKRLGFIACERPSHLRNQESLDLVDFIPLYLEKDSPL